MQINANCWFFLCVCANVITMLLRVINTQLSATQARAAIKTKYILLNKSLFHNFCMCLSCGSMCTIFSKRIGYVQIISLAFWPLSKNPLGTDLSCTQRGEWWRSSRGKSSSPCTVPHVSSTLERYSPPLTSHSNTYGPQGGGTFAW